jgi:NTE family protein
LTLAMAAALAPVTAADAQAQAHGQGQAQAGQGARAPGRPKTCLVLSGGGARGAAHVGVLKVLEELRVPIDCVVGTSMGAIVGAAWVSGVSPTELETVLRETRWNVVLADEPPRPRRSWRNKEFERARIVGAELGLRDGKTVLPTGAVFGQQFDGLLQRLLGSPVTRESFDELPLPFRAIATDIESGTMVVLDRGSLNAAVRASMSVPGALAPQEIGGRLLVDGGLVRNLGVDVARSIGAQRVIAVNLGTPLSSREQIGSLLGVTGQMIAILTEQNVMTSLGQLGPEDVLISPELGAFSAADFAAAYTKVEAGEQAARQVADRLAPLALDEEAYVAWRDAHVRVRPPQALDDRIRVATADLQHVDPRFVRSVFDRAVADGPREGAVDRAVEALYAMDDFQQVTARTVSATDGDEIVVEPLEKRWGPNYLRFGLTLSTDLEGESAFTVIGDYRSTWLNSRGLEWRTTASIGDVTSLRTETLQPIDSRQRWLAGAFAEGRRRIDDFFIGNESVGQFRNSLFTVGIEARSRYATDAEFRVGLRRTWYELDPVSGLIFSADAPDASAVFARATLDRLDDWDFPRSGTFARAELERAYAVLGAESRYTKGVVEVQQAFGRGPHSLSALLRFGATSGDALPLAEAFELGGFQNLSGFSDRQVLAERIAFGRVVYGYQIGSGGTLAPRLYAGGSLEAADLSGRLNAGFAVPESGDSGKRVLGAGSLFIAADTALGPAYVAVGFAEGGERAFYLFLGRP